AGLRRIIDEEMVRTVLAVLQDDLSEMPKNWNRRFKHNRDKIKTGDIYELAEVVRNLAIREHEKGLSTGEKQMYTRAKKILASELMYALDKSEEDAEAYLDDLRRGIAGGRLDKRGSPLLLARGRGDDDRPHGRDRGEGGYAPLEQAASRQLDEGLRAAGSETLPGSGGRDDGRCLDAARRSPWRRSGPPAARRGRTRRPPRPSRART
ncbi:MAG: CarD family transcriptional regulator, partial [Solirubrobacterales bacterium]|nr:CarD family transcriptional regulator [Solirubrobacterales bacterium]